MKLSLRSHPAEVRLAVLQSSSARDGWLVPAQLAAWDVRTGQKRQMMKGADQKARKHLISNENY